MEPRQVLRRKSTLMVILAVASLLVILVTGAIYYSVVMQPRITVVAPPLIFVQGNDWPTGSALGTNSTWLSLALEAYPNMTVVYEQAVNVSNTDASSHNFRLRHTSISPASGQPEVSNFTFFNFCIQDTAGVTQATFNYTTTGTTWNIPSPTAYLSLPAGTQWIIYVETKAAAGAQSDVSADLGITVDIQQ